MPRKLERKAPVPVELHLFIRHLKFAREQRKFTQQELGEIAGLSKKYISQLETENVNAGLDSMGHISQAVQIPLYCMFDPLLIKNWEQTKKEWDGYQKLIDNSNESSYERKIFSENFRKTRKIQGYLLKEVVEQAQVNQKFLVNVEKIRCGISIAYAVKLANFLTIPLALLLTPSETSQYKQPDIHVKQITQTN